jgi:hypothetical protein
MATESVCKNLMFADKRTYANEIQRLPQFLRLFGGVELSVAQKKEKDGLFNKLSVFKKRISCAVGNILNKE